MAQRSQAGQAATEVSRVPRRFGCIHPDSESGVAASLCHPIPKSPIEAARVKKSRGRSGEAPSPILDHFGLLLYCQFALMGALTKALCGRKR
jgi:hypothetical protein